MQRKIFLIFLISQVPLKKINLIKTKKMKRKIFQTMVVLKKKMEKLLINLILMMKKIHPPPQKRKKSLMINKYKN